MSFLLITLTPASVLKFTPTLELSSSPTPILHEHFFPATTPSLKSSSITGIDDDDEEELEVVAKATSTDDNEATNDDGETANKDSSSSSSFSAHLSASLRQLTHATHDFTCSIHSRMVTYARTPVAAAVLLSALSANTPSTDGPLYSLFASEMKGKGPDQANLAGCHGKKQEEALRHFYKVKLQKNSTMEKELKPTQFIVDTAKTSSEIKLKKHDKIKRLPGQPFVDFSQYGGYVVVDKIAGRALYYYFVEAQHSKHSLPLLLWLNGGPGCSSLMGAMQELGPFRVHSDGNTLYRNKFTWNKAANILFLETPAGVGFSYSNVSSDYTKGGDKRTAKDNYIFLLNWLERFPEYKNKEFFISGESYAGHYVPQLAHAILQHNKKAKKTIINLKGIIIGNAVINDETDQRGMFDYYHDHGLISDETIYEIHRHCNFSAITTESEECEVALEEVNKDLYYIETSNIYSPLCHSSNLTAKPKRTSTMEFDPCSDYYVHAYLNKPDVQKALHANVTKIKYDWETCSNVLQVWEDSPSTIIPLLQEFMENRVRVWVYSGDVDANVPFTSTKYSINAMKLRIKKPWYPWYLDGEVGGYAVVYENLTFATVRGAGHEVPSYQPKRALSLIMHFLNGTSLPETLRYD
ncbi:serine carboxypeptidase-like 40 [Malania oleifera]|uniref:serine carboxypeptidase-like 40 n=1 Tax=Malania oleifera TaxID=397392 RepID=UPI0025ADE22A|nr:serine carboxypeptidase-like 40 [Malania oleifera]